MRDNADSNIRLLQQVTALVQPDLPRDRSLSISSKDRERFNRVRAQPTFPPSPTSLLPARLSSHVVAREAGRLGAQ
jgi:hypothetical protein